MRRQRTHRVLAEEPSLDLDTGKAIAIGGKAGDIFVVQPRPDRQTLEGLAFFHQFAEAATVFRQDLDNGAQAIDGGLEIEHFRRRDFERKRRVISGQNDAVAIKDHPAVGRNRDQRNAIVLSAGDVVVVLDDLQAERSDRSAAEKTAAYGAGRKGNAETEAVEFAILRIQWRGEAATHESPFQIGRLASCSIGWCCGKSSTPGQYRPEHGSKDRPEEIQKAGEVDTGGEANRDLGGLHDREQRRHAGLAAIAETRESVVKTARRNRRR